MDTDQSTSEPGEDDEGSQPDFGRRNPLEVGVQLRNLLNRGDFITLHYRGGQLATRILDVDVRQQTFVFDWGSVPVQNEAVLRAEACHFLASPEGVRVEFSTGTPRETRFDGRSAFEAAFPEVLYYVQRREYFRVDTPVLEPCLCAGALPDGTGFRWEVNDLSLGGLGLRTTDERAADLEMGTRIPDVDLDLRSHGTLNVELGLVGKRFVDLPNGTRRYHLGFRFESLPGTTENTLQRYITQLEMKRRSLVRG
ncbi:flagellar brake protein [Burkholderia sp. WAC0059]|uniref:flagellar brake protein n=1 Tax=Burkholderia sp. WAC0059 TaxID=2066022 RepID=UPI000C7F4AE2|nr:flagellar brake protein [Burkholderia sp. WAC0059]PLZ00666.1 flagellar brake protein [Burkholderia sp. WAC0059]